MKKVFILITKSNWGGAQKYVYDLATSSISKKYDITVLFGGSGELQKQLLEKKIRCIEIKSLQRDVSLFRDFKVFWELLKIFSNERPDVVHLNSTKVSGLGALAGRVVGIKKIIFTVHGFAFNENRSIFSKILIKFLYIITAWLSHRIIMVSSAIYLQASSWPFIKSKMRVIHNGTREPSFLERFTAREFLSGIIKRKIPKNTLLLMSIGELHEVKGHVYAIDAVKMLKEASPGLDIVYLIIGDGDLRKSLEIQVNRAQLSTTIYFAGQLKQAAQYLRAADVFLFPSISEALGYAVIEAGFAGLPVVASRVGGILEIISKESCGILVSPKDSFAIHSAILEYIQNPEKSGVYGQNLFSLVCERFSLQPMLFKTLEVYES